MKERQKNNNRENGIKKIKTPINEEKKEEEKEEEEDDKDDDEEEEEEWNPTICN